MEEEYNTFNWQYYIHKYEDLQKANINDKDKAWYHWINYGIIECRSYNIESDYIPIKNTVLHIFHNFGGGTEVYINYLCKTFNNYNHIKVKIINENYVKINDVFYDRNTIIPYLKLFSLSLIIVHHLLYSNNGYKMTTNILDVLIEKYSDLNKIYIIHDYHLLYPYNPTPNFSFINEPLSSDILNANIILNKFNKVIFNTQNTYNNYKKYLEIPNALILNNVPDIDIYRNRCFPTIKNKYIIALIGDIYAEHKGKPIAEKIFKLFENDDKYFFVIIGTYHITHSNLKIIGRYDNNNIYNLIEENKVDYFLFLSEETYSFTLSIALNTGLPIIYNNIGSYHNRLSCYDNCYPFNEDNIIIISSILNNMKYNDEYLYCSYPEMNKNIPELAPYLIHDNFSFSFSVINKHIKIGNVYFIILINEIDNRGYNNFLLFYKYLKNTIYDKLDYIFVSIYGENIYLPQDYKIKLIYYNEDINIWKDNYMEMINLFSMNMTNVTILYYNTINNDYNLII